MYGVFDLETPPSSLYTVQPKGGQKVIVVRTIDRKLSYVPKTDKQQEPHRHAGVSIARGKEDMLCTKCLLCTKSMAPSVSVYGEKRITVDSPAPTFFLTERQRKERCCGSRNRRIEPDL